MAGKETTAIGGRAYQWLLPIMRLITPAEETRFPLQAALAEGAPGRLSPSKSEGTEKACLFSLLIPGHFHPLAAP